MWAMIFVGSVGSVVKVSKAWIVFWFTARIGVDAEAIGSCWVKGAAVTTFCFLVVGLEAILVAPFPGTTAASSSG
jgi:hypothetical protein